VRWVGRWCLRNGKCCVTSGMMNLKFTFVHFFIVVLCCVSVFLDMFTLTVAKRKMATSGWDITLTSGPVRAHLQVHATSAPCLPYSRTIRPVGTLLRCLFYWQARLALTVELGVVLHMQCCRRMKERLEDRGRRCRGNCPLV
jgi:hypothetical protein